VVPFSVFVFLFFPLAISYQQYVLFRGRFFFVSGMEVPILHRFSSLLTLATPQPDRFLS